MEINFINNKKKKKKMKDDAFDIEYSSIKKTDKEKEGKKKRKKEKKKSLTNGLFSFFKNRNNRLVNKDIHKSRKEILRTIKEERKKRKKKKKSGKIEKNEKVKFLLKEDDGKKDSDIKKVDVDYIGALKKNGKIKHKETPVKYSKKDKGTGEKATFEYTNSRKEEVKDKEKKHNNKELKKEKDSFFLVLLSKVKRFVKKGDKGKNNTEEKNTSNNKVDEAGSAHLVETNLIKDRIIVYFDWKKNMIIFGIFLTMSVALLSGIHYGFSVWAEEKNKEIEKINNEIAFLDEKIKLAEIEAKEVVMFKNKLSLAKELLNQHIYWTNFFDFLEKNTLENIYYSGFNGGYGEDYTLNAIADSYASIEAQVRRMKENEYITDVKVDSGQSQLINDGKAEGVGFDLEIEIDHKMLLD